MDAKQLLKTLKNTTDEDNLLKIIPKLGKYAKGKTVENALVDLLEAGSEKIRAAAIDALLTNPHKRIKKLIMAHMTDTNLVKEKCFEYTGYHKMKQAEPILLAHLNNSDHWVRYFAILNIGDMGSYELIEDVKKHLESEINDVVKSGGYLTLYLLSETDEDIEYNRQKLIELLNSSDDEARFVTINTLADIGGHFEKEKVIQALSKQLEIEEDVDNIIVLKWSIRILKYYR
ncbi:HEAT repeat domain-containing protein [Listeria monocytogenes]|uniref:HEAT repeat domain-containing protein n=1 Tax=Listeria monocytogenes TaxID=1639 RepID=UPI000F26CEAE|nr:HEAT repeat domain-containing protein [Listeria monocytogenes]EAD3584971.1 HEAT repeat domain-containing protein [Listeria monocytogenes]EAF1856245.1 HEAT repeat domain-containing protein [Listeria monocytogenes]EAF2103895.1 HEAT repeat domain-containing protein [Listeria monocytogenes]ECX6968778.1 HEAT repeat domain-containing protein [Listeria monocytogenes]EDN7594216.1 HEAT repeat domain-containing protein [Listeria monocytogenes]